MEDAKYHGLEKVDSLKLVSTRKRRTPASRCQYWSFKRLSSLPVDADQKGVSLTFKNGVLMVTMPRKVAPEIHLRQIEIQSA